jgi:putative oxidoreductase
MSTYIQGVVALAARVLLSQLFLFATVNHLLHWNSIVQLMADKGLAFEPVFGRMGIVFAGFLHAGAVAFLAIGGLSVLLGVRARLGAVLLLLFLIPVTLTFHDFWRYGAEDPQRATEMGNFMKNAALGGGLLMVLAFGAGPLSLRRFLPKRRARPAEAEEDGAA